MLSVDQLPFLTSAIPGVGGVIKQRPEDFVVDEVPLYEASGSGTHVYFRIEKVGLPTTQAVQEIARALGRQKYEIGYAGLKDADAVTRQTLSLEHVDPARVEALSVPGVKVLSVSRHTNKLKLGHHRGNRFTIKLRQVDAGRVDDARSILDVLMRRGVPNYFGPQRFGVRGDTWEIGRALVRKDFDEALAVMLGRPSPVDRGKILEARQLFDRGEYDAAAAAWPYMYRNERRACRELARTRGKAFKALRAVDQQARRFYISAFQSMLFNQIVARRIETLDTLMAGDLAWRHPQGAVFRVEDVAKEQPRCDAFEISPTGPLFGHRMTEPDGEPGRMERGLLEEENLGGVEWLEDGKRRTPGGRRPLRFKPHDAGVTAGRDDAGDYIEVTFFLESGCYATTVLREITKSSRVAPDAAEES
ncbi:MAG TPA: tRNA pseudouridine(13) synthase TruD [Phycisphaerae bacterium]|nr:tRNA pseudouridine(13) synthase TruD [Phycisphaerae bacterium]HOM52764.1 tRNA pseudouridine(13) synthase TruD [Phycisphaerae bacterium]HON66592.1 tRNA pseudouridine(13) synthase TruD [Phycisphaerae bacterium]HOQ86907.1 tRNA pseudouridine(13) synthase TruD [Phycisphaerae bacterium]HPP28467.1 tRNA pseudouridine(13) synthase TruD [Phycisphaerae bacterium]